MGKTSHPMVLGGTKGSTHVLQQAGGLLPAYLGPQALSLNTGTVWGDISKTILKDKEVSKNLRRMTDLLLSLSSVTKVVYPGFHAGQKLLQIQLIPAHAQDLSDLEDMDERGTTKMLGNVEESIVCDVIKVGIFMHIKKRKRLMQDLGFNMKDMSAELLCNITNFYDSAKDLSAWSVEFKKIVQSVLETNILCVMEALMDYDLGWLLAVPKSKLSKGKNFFQNLWCAWLFIERVRKTSAFHTINGSFHNVVKIYQTALNTFLTVDKRGTLVRQLEHHIVCYMQLIHTPSLPPLCGTSMLYISYTQTVGWPNRWRIKLFPY